MTHIAAAATVIFIFVSLPASNVFVLWAPFEVAGKVIGETGF